jgi:hypothetical protein
MVNGPKDDYAHGLTAYDTGSLTRGGTSAVNFRGISRRSIDELCAANRMFLSLLRRRLERVDGVVRLGLEPGCDALVRRLDAEAATQVARCPFALFSLDFQNRAVWRGLLERRVGEPELAPWADADSDLAQFLLTVLAAVRYLSSHEPAAASMLYGVAPDLGRRLASVDLALLPGLASDARSRLSVALADAPAFWRDLLLLSGERPGGGVHAVHALGLQLTMQRALGLKRCQAASHRLIRSC